MKIIKCDIVGCDDIALYEDEFQINYCHSCMLHALTEDKEESDFEEIIDRMDK